MSKPAICYAVTFGLSGCYMPDSHCGVYRFETRRDLAETIKRLLSDYDMPAALFREVNIRKLWAFLKTRGASCAHFHLSHKGYSLSFNGLTEEEYEAESERD